MSKILGFEQHWKNVKLGEKKETELSDTHLHRTSIFFSSINAYKCC